MKQASNWNEPQRLLGKLHHVNGGVVSLFGIVDLLVRSITVSGAKSNQALYDQ